MPTILLVDDSPIDRKIAVELLTSVGGMKLLQAHDGVEAIGMLSEFQPDVVVTDLQMPRMNGLELVTAIGRQHPDLPVILVTARGSEELAVQALAMGAASYVSKARFATELFPTIARVLDARHAKSDVGRFRESMIRSDAVYALDNDASLLISAAGEITVPLKATWNWPQREVLRVRMALEEALLNALYHGNLELSTRLRDADLELYYELARRRSAEYPHVSRKVRVSVSFTRDDISFEISDEGAGFNHATFTSQQGIEAVSRPYGRGIVLMKSVMDEVVFNTTGNSVRLTKRRQQPRTDEDTQSEQAHTVSETGFILSEDQ